MIESTGEGSPPAGQTTLIPGLISRFQDKPLGALTAAGVAAALLIVGVALPVVVDGQPGFSSGPLLIALVLVPFVGALLLLLTRRPASAGGVLVGVAVPVPAGMLLDLQFLTSPWEATRPERYFPDDLAAHDPAPGVWFLLAGHAVVIVAAVLAFRTVSRRASDADGNVELGLDDALRQGATRGWRQRWLLPAMFLAVLAACGLLMSPYSSNDVYLLSSNAFEGPALELGGHVLLACLVPLGTALLMTSTVGTAFTRGGLAGVAIGIIILAAPNVAAGISVDVLEVSVGPVMALVAAAVLCAIAMVRPGESDVSAPGADDPVLPRELPTPSARRLEVVTGVLAIGTAVLALVGARTDQLSATGQVSVPESPVQGAMFSAGLLIGLLGLAMFLPSMANLVRPVLSVTWVSVPISGTAVLDTAITGTSVPGLLSTGPGVLWTWLAMCAATLTACSSVITGFVNRENVEFRPFDGADGGVRSLSRVGTNMMVPLATAGLLTIGAFSWPVSTATDYTEAGIWLHFGTPSWGLILGLVTVLGALALAPKSRPMDAVALLTGAACVLGLRAVTLPITRGHVDNVGAAPGFWLALAGIIALVIAIGIVVGSASSGIMGKR